MRNNDTRTRISWTLYIVGSLLVFGSWINLIPTGLGWFGWLIALGGWAIGSLPQRQKLPATRTPATLSKAEEIANLDLLHKEDMISDEEFEREKQRILRTP